MARHFPGSASCACNTGSTFSTVSSGGQLEHVQILNDSRPFAVVGDQRSCAARNTALDKAPPGADSG